MVKKITFFSFSCLFVLLLVFSLYRTWFGSGLISAGDFWPQYPEQYRDFSVWPHAWNNNLGQGLGQSSLYILWNHFFLNLPFILFGQLITLPFVILERIGYLYPLLLLEFAGVYLFSKLLFPSDSWSRLLMGFLYVSTSYILMIVGGGQLTIAFGYAQAPIIFYLFMKSVHSRSLLNSVLFGLAVAVGIMFDLRMVFITVLGIFIYWSSTKVQDLVAGTVARINLHETAFALIMCVAVPLFVVIGIHGYWIWPSLFFSYNPFAQVGPDYNSLSALRFFSFAPFDQAFSLLHPNWPENIFGKIYFLRPEFLFFPMLAYLPLVFLHERRQSSLKTLIIGFSFLGLIGAFFGKGAQEPLGPVYEWFFVNVPGFAMYRDPTKWYLLTSLAYSVLIPIGLQTASQKINDWYKTINVYYIHGLLVLSVVGFVALLANQLFTTANKGIFAHTNLPEDYVRLKDLMVEQSPGYRTLWVPSRSRFAYFTNQVIGIDALGIFGTDINKLGMMIEKGAFGLKLIDFLAQSGIKYVIVPDDSEQEIFLTDRKYDEKLRLKILNDLDNLVFFDRRLEIGKIVVYEVKGVNNLFWVTDDKVNKSVRLKYEQINPTRYKVRVDGLSGQPISLIFSQRYDPGWRARSSESDAQSQIYLPIWNSFRIQKNGVYEIEYMPQTLVDRSLWITFATALVLLIFFPWRIRLYGKSNK